MASNTEVLVMFGHELYRWIMDLQYITRKIEMAKNDVS
jgi:hypothetical protein